ncbi:hypothetical protein ACSDR0_04570 [Streptosporangium sp. G11]|uniref:hypothetical protein n=1 Tax=Streptosporangium sp. G11 TaxID=3436926 RepID=UPI003EB78B88
MSKLMSLTAAVANRTALTVPQLEGWACVICAVLGIPAVFVGMIGGREVYACNSCAISTPPATPAAPATTCPAWCGTDHLNGVDVEHESGLDVVHPGHEFMTGLRQQPGDEVLIVLSDDERSEGTLTVEQAEHLVEHLQTLITAARQGARSS